jgi:hypothetical protein
MKWQVHIRLDKEGEPVTTDFFALIIDDVVCEPTRSVLVNNLIQSQDIVEFLYDAKSCPAYIPERNSTQRVLDVCPHHPDHVSGS